MCFTKNLRRRAVGKYLELGLQDAKKMLLKALYGPAAAASAPSDPPAAGPTEPSNAPAAAPSNLDLDPPSHRSDPKKWAFWVNLETARGNHIGDIPCSVWWWVLQDVSVAGWVGSRGIIALR